MLSNGNDCVSVSVLMPGTQLEKWAKQQGAAKQTFKGLDAIR